MDKNKLWNIVLSELELVLSKANFRTWLFNTYISEINDDGENIVVAVPNNFSKKWLEEKYHRSILNVLQEATENKVRKVLYKVVAVKEEPAPEPAPVEVVTSDATRKSKKNGYGLNPKYTFENFIVGKGSELAHAACMAVAQNPGKKYNPLFIYGGVGLGKTHLLQAIGHKILNENAKIKTLCTDAEKFTNEFVQSIRDGTIDKFKRVYRGLDVFLIDDIQFLTGKEQTQQEFFHTFNSLYQENRQIVITSDRPPKAIPALEDRLVSRLEWGLIADISAPDLETRLAILKAKCDQQKCGLSEEILQYLAVNIQNNVRELEGALNKLVAYYEFHRTDVDLDTVKSILSTLKTPEKKGFIQPKQLIDIVANFYGIRTGEMIGPSRKRELVAPRQIAMYLLREEIDASYPLIGKELGGRDHTTAMHAYEKIKTEIKKEGRIKQEVDLIKQRLYNQ